MKRASHEQSSPFLSLESHFLNVYHAGIYLSAREMAKVGRECGIDIPLKSREVILKKLLNTANEEGKLSEVITLLSGLIQNRVQTLQAYALDFPHAASFIHALMQKSKASNLLLQRHLQANPYE